MQIVDQLESIGISPEKVSPNPKNGIKRESIQQLSLNKDQRSIISTIPPLPLIKGDLTTKSV